MNESLIVVSLRGGMDALNAVVPFREEAYYSARPTTAVPAPGSPGASAIEIDERFALHPSLAPLLPLYERRELAIVHAVGWPGESHSHFEIWDEIESGAPGEDRPRTGWVARYLARRPARPGAVMRAVAFADTMPRLLTGFAGASVMRGLPGAVLPGDAARDRRMRAALRALHADGSELGESGMRTLDALGAMAGLASADPAPGYPKTDFGEQLRSVELLLRAEVGLEAASVELGGWDTHIAQGSVSGVLASRLNELARGISTFVERNRDRMDRVTIVVMSEFGRRLAENASGGTDHGQGGAMLLLGRGVRGGRVYGDWPGLVPERLAGPGDIAATTDVRDVLGELVATRAGDSTAAAVFPGHRPRSSLSLFET